MKYVPKSWGWERWIINNDLYCGKILVIRKGCHCSFHYHKIKDEVLYVENGEMVMVTNTLAGDQRRLDRMVPGMAWHMTPGTPHQMYAVEDTFIHEFSTHHEDSDSYRVSTELQFTQEELCDLVRLKTNGSNEPG